MYKRYSNPLELLKQIAFEELGDFLLYLHDDDIEQQLFDIWLHKPVEQSFSDFKAEMMPTRTTTRTKSEEELLAFESQFISDTGGGTQ